MTPQKLLFLSILIVVPMVAHADVFYCYQGNPSVVDGRSISGCVEVSAPLPNNLPFETIPGLVSLTFSDGVQTLTNTGQGNDEFKIDNGVITEWNIQLGGPGGLDIETWGNLVFVVPSEEISISSEGFEILTFNDPGIWTPEPESYLLLLSVIAIVVFVMKRRSASWV